MKERSVESKQMKTMDWLETNHAFQAASQMDTFDSNTDWVVARYHAKPAVQRLQFSHVCYIFRRLYKGPAS